MIFLFDELNWWVIWRCVIWRFVIWRCV